MEGMQKLVKNWSSKGREEALVLFKESFLSFNQDCMLNLHRSADSSLYGLFYDLFSCCLDSDIDSDELGDFCKSLLTSLDSSPILPSLITDVLSSLDAEVSCSEDKSQRKSLRSLILSLVSVTGDELMKERLDMDSLEAAGFISSKNSFNQKYVKTKTKIYYKQQKFNLCREENEGFSKLISELGHEPLVGVDHEQVLDSIKSLIGRFSMDPNRVLDVILQALESHFDQRHFFIPLLRSYPCAPSTFINILGFKYHTYHLSDTEGHYSPTPPSLYYLTAVLLNEGMIDIHGLTPHLRLSMEEFKELHQSITDNANAIYRKANIVTLTDKTDEEKEKEAEAAQKLKEDHKAKLSLEHNQILGICHACLEQGDWPSARSIINQLPPNIAMASPQLVQSLCRLVEYCIEPLYRLHAPRGTTPSPLSSSFSVSRCQSFKDMVPMAMEMIYALGPHLHSDPILLCKIVRLGKAFLKEMFPSSDPSRTITNEHLENEVLRWYISIIDGVVLPSLSMLQFNCGMAEEVWSMIRLLPYETRYMLYGYWKNESYSNHPDLLIVKCDTLNKGKYIMKRLTKDNVKQSGRQLGKLNNSNPGIIFDYVLSQIQRYDNFIIPVVDSLKYLTPIAYDVLAYCIIEALGNPQKERLKLEDTNLSSWLQILASFSANIFKKYPVDLTGLLQYVTNQLKAGKSFDLLVLKEVIQKMAGIEISDEITAAQLEAMAGGELLKAEGGYFSQVRNTKKSSQRLREALVDSNLCLPLCLLTAQQRDCIVYRDGSHLHLKLVCSMYDNCMDTLVQFGGFLSSHLSPDEYSKRVPSLDTLIQEYRMTGDVAFFLYRPKIFSSIGVKFAELEKSFKSVTNESKKSIMNRQEKHFITSCEEVFGPIIESVKPLQPSKVWEDINCSFYVAFWSLSLYDLHVPKDRYNDEINKAKDVIQVLENNQEMPASKKKKEQERSQALIDKLTEEKKRQEDNHQLIISYLRNQKDSFINPRVLKSRTLNRLLQLCIFPRCRFTTLDAIYCAKFIQTLHILETPNFSTILLLDKLFSDVSCTVSACTENEVRRYGHFLYYLLEMIGRWHNSESIYIAECANTQGFVSTMKSSASGNEKLNLDYENYRHVTHKWHYKITKSLVMCLESKDYIQIRNGLLLLTKILPHYPKVEHLSLVLERRVGKIIEEEKDKRQDLYVLAIGYAGMLKTQAPNLIPETEFHEKVIKKEEPDTLSNGKDEKPKAKPAPSSSQASDKPKPPEKPKVSTKTPKAPEKVKSSENKVPTPPATEKPSSTERTEKPKSTQKPSESKTDKTSSSKTTGGGGGGGGGGSESKRTPSAERVSSTTAATAAANNVTAKTGAAADKVEPKSSSKVDHKSTDSKPKQSEDVKTSKPVKTEPVSSQTTPTSDAKNIKKDEVIQATATSTTEPKKGVVTTPTLESKKVPMLSLEKLPSGRVTRQTDSDSPRGQRRPHPATTGGQSNSSEPHDKDPKKRKMEETSTPTKAGHSSSPSADKKVTTTTAAAATPTGGEGGDKTSGKTSNNVTTQKPEKKRERLPDKEGPPANSEAVNKKRRESAPGDSSKETTPAAQPEPKKRIIKVVKSDKADVSKKRAKSPPTALVTEEKIKKLSTTKPTAKKTT